MLDPAGDEELAPADKKLHASKLKAWVSEHSFLFLCRGMCFQVSICKTQ
jgi:hypothetical protein